ncbi:MAG TPA: Trk family potassium uptake protein [Dehalococcoidia bacterium]|nr:Trk family potassium uptake protein [SAR202 cluster bacterium]HAA95816.1 Trk family potassium uptake protein [Dehalococcoidia bacterium]HCL25482.1 Trk family potassium uptake protein [Dehalococcoidia bacterium]
MASDRRRRPMDNIIRLRRRRELSPTVTESEPPRAPKRWFGTTTILLGGFALLMLAGGGLLTLPVAHHGSGFTAMETAFFTSVSAVTVTGLTVVETPVYWSTFGQAVIFVLMLVGGLGFMVLSTFILLLIGQRATLEERLLTRGLMRDTVGVDQMQGLRQISRAVIGIVFLLYAAGTAIFFWQIHNMEELSDLNSVWHSLFLSVSSFNNAGFNIIPEVPGGSVTRFISDPTLLITMTVLTMLGGLGWVFMVDVFRQRRFARFSLDTKLVLVTSVSLWVLGAAVLYVAELANDDALSWVDKGVGAVFQSVSGRTAGFAIMDFGEVKDVTKSTFSGLMFIGGAAGSVAGGIKVATFAVLMAAVVSSLKGRAHAEAFGREIHQSQLHRALTVAVLGLGLIVVSATVLTTLEPEIPFLDIIFDTVSAIGTTGASTGIISDTGLASKILLMVLMYVGRLGPVALALALAPEEDPAVYRYAQESVKIG